MSNDDTLGLLFLLGFVYFLYQSDNAQTSVTTSQQIQQIPPASTSPVTTTTQSVMPTMTTDTSTSTNGSILDTIVTDVTSILDASVWNIPGIPGIDIPIDTGPTDASNICDPNDPTCIMGSI